MKDERETKEKLLQSARAEFLAKGYPTSRKSRPTWQGTQGSTAFSFSVLSVSYCSSFFPSGSLSAFHAASGLFAKPICAAQPLPFDVCFVSILAHFWQKR